MKTPDEIKKGLECCSVGRCTWDNGCPYGASNACATELKADALALVQQYESGMLVQAELCAKLRDEDVPIWISVEDKLPKRYEHVLVATRFTDEGEQDVEVAYLALDRWRKPDGPLFGKVTHWMPLPLPPSSPDGESTSLGDGGLGTT